MSSNAIVILTTGLAPEVRDAATRRYETFVRELAYMKGRGHQRWKDLTELGWSMPRLETVAALLAFHDVVIGPLRAVALVRTTSGSPLVVPVVAGSLRIDDAFVANVEPMLDGFDALLEELNVPQRALGARSARDLAYWLIRRGRGEV